LNGNGNAGVGLGGNGNLESIPDDMWMAMNGITCCLCWHCCSSDARTVGLLSARNA